MCTGLPYKYTSLKPNRGATLLQAVEMLQHLHRFLDVDIITPYTARVNLDNEKNIDFQEKDVYYGLFSTHGQSHVYSFYLLKISNNQLSIPLTRL